MSPAGGFMSPSMAAVTTTAATTNIPKPTRPIDVLPASQYLQDRLQERRSRVARPRRTRHTDVGLQISGRDDDIFLAEAEDSRRSNARMMYSSPLAFNGRASASGSEAGGSTSSSTRRRALGIRDMDQYIDKLTKENFDLKLELDHRREQTERLKEQIERMRDQAERAQQLADEHTELLKINSQLVEELEKRDRAVEEAMDIICDLEDKVAELEERSGTNTRPSTAQADSGYAGTETQEQVPPSSPPECNVPRTPLINVKSPSLPAASAASQKLQTLMNGRTPVRARRQPLALSTQKPSTHALRSVYLESTRELNPVKSFHSLLSKQESHAEDDEDCLNSPRLSSLSESSFPSLYSPQKQISPDRYAWESAIEDGAPGSPLAPQSHLRQDSIKRVNQWISERDAAENTPSKSNHISAPMADPTGSHLENSPPPLPPQHGHLKGSSHLQSLNGTSNFAPETPILSAPPVFPVSRSRSDKPRPTNSASRVTSFAGPIFGEPLLPPTPDSASTRMLRASRSSINADERSLLDITPAPIKNFNALEPGIRTAPRQMRSSVELRTALASNIEFRNTDVPPVNGLVSRRESSSEEEDAYAELDSLVELGGFSSPERDSHNGKRLLSGTPIQPAKPGKSPLPSHNFLALPQHTRATPARRRSSAEISHSPNMGKPVLTRLETSPPVFVSSLNKLSAALTAHPKSSVETIITSPRSTHSSSSGVRTIVPADGISTPAPSSQSIQSSSTVTPSASSQHIRAMSPDSVMRNSPLARSNSVVTSTPIAGRSRMSPSPARATLTQRTQSLFRRLSNSQGSDREREQGRDAGASTSTAGVRSLRPEASEKTVEKSSKQLPLLPTLTSTPASVLNQDTPRRPRTSSGDQYYQHPNAHQRNQGTAATRRPTSRGTATNVEASSTSSSGIGGRKNSMSSTADHNGSQSNSRRPSIQGRPRGMSFSRDAPKERDLRRESWRSGAGHNLIGMDCVGSPTKETAVVTSGKDAPTSGIPNRRNSSTAYTFANTTPTAVNTATSKDRKTLFRRSNSHKNQDLSASFLAGLVSPTIASPVAGEGSKSNAAVKNPPIESVAAEAKEPDSGGVLRGFTKRRGSMREAVQKRAWR